MVNVFKSVESDEEIVLVDAGYQDSGHEISSEIETSEVQMLNLNMIHPIEYRVGSGAWNRLEPRTQNTLVLDLSTTSIFVRRIRYTEPGYVRVLKTSTSVSLDVEGSGTDASLMLNGEAVGSTNGDASPVTSITYDGSDRVSTYVKSGVTYTCAYYTTGNGTGKLQTITGGGVTRTYTYNANGLVTDEVVT